MTVDQTARDLKPERSPSAIVPLGLMAFAAVNLTLLTLYLAWFGPEVTGTYLRNKMTLVATHLFTLGFATPVAMGAIYQMVPVLLYSRLPWPWIAIGQWLLHAAGTWLMIFGFWHWHVPLIVTGGSIVTVGVILFISQLAALLRRTERRQLQAPAMAGAAVYLLLTVSWGIVAALNLRYGFLGSGADIIVTHIALGLGGWLLLLTCAVSYRLVPMFASSRPGPEWPRRVVLPGIGVLPIIIAAGAAFNFPSVTRFGSIALALAAGLYAGDLIATVRRRRRGSIPPVTFWTAGAAWGLLVTAILLLLALAVPGFVPPDRPGRLLAIAILSLFGWQSTMIMGQMTRIVPFIIWLSRFRRRWVREKLPFLHQIIGGRVPGIALALWLTGVAILATGAAVSDADGAAAALSTILVRTGGIVLTGGGILWAGQVLVSYRHLYHRAAPGASTELDPTAIHLHDPGPTPR